MSDYINDQEYQANWTRIKCEQKSCEDEVEELKPGMRGGHQMCLDHENGWFSEFILPLADYLYVRISLITSYFYYTIARGKLFFSFWITFILKCFLIKKILIGYFVLYYFVHLQPKFIQCHKNFLLLFENYYFYTVNGKY